MKNQQEKHNLKLIQNNGNDFLLKNANSSRVEHLKKQNI